MSALRGDRWPGTDGQRPADPPFGNYPADAVAQEIEHEHTQCFPDQHLAGRAVGGLSGSVEHKQPDLIGFVVGYVLLSILHRGYGSLVFNVVSYVIFSNLEHSQEQRPGGVGQAGADVEARPGHRCHSAEVRTDLEISLLATSITLTPGTLSVDTGWNAWRAMRCTHNLVMGNAEDVRRSIKTGFRAAHPAHHTRREMDHDRGILGQRRSRGAGVVAPALLCAALSGPNPPNRTVAFE